MERIWLLATYKLLWMQCVMAEAGKSTNRFFPRYTAREEKIFFVMGMRICGPKANNAMTGIGRCHCNVYKPAQFSLRILSYVLISTFFFLSSAVLSFPLQWHGSVSKLQYEQKNLNLDIHNLQQLTIIVTMTKIYTFERWIKYFERERMTFADNPSWFAFSITWWIYFR